MSIYLKEGDTIALVAPAAKLPEGIVNRAVSLFQSWGLKVLTGKYVETDSVYFAATDEERAADIQYFINHSEVKAIICLRGGYGSIRTLEYLNFSGFITNPKLLVGFSDVTVFHALLNCHLGIESIHATMPVNFPDHGENQSTDSLKQALFGELKGYNITPHKLNIQGSATGKLIGGNLAVLQSIASTFCDINTENSILFIEDVGEYAYSVDRMLMNLAYSGKLSQLSGIIAGSFTQIKDEDKFGKTVYEIIHSHVHNLGIPIAFGMQAGHTEPNLALYLGRKVQLNVKNQSVELVFG